MILERGLLYQNEIVLGSSKNIAIGSEVCPAHFLRKANNDAINEAAKQKKSIRLVTPIVPQKYLDEIYNIICSLPTHSKVTFNDYGLLYKCRELIASSKIIPVLGRIITRSLIDCPWYEDIVKDDSQYIDIFKKNNMHFEAKIEFLRDWGIKEIEVNNCPQESLDYFHKKRINVAQYSTYNLLSVSRTCFCSKLAGKPTLECYKEKECSSLSYSIKMTDCYSSKYKLLVPNNSTIIDWKDVIIFGTALLIKNKNINKKVDYLIV